MGSLMQKVPINNIWINFIALGREPKTGSKYEMIYLQISDINYKSLAEEIKKYLLENPHLIKQGDGN